MSADTLAAVNADLLIQAAVQQLHIHQCTGVVHIISQRPHPVSPLRQVCFRRLSRLVWTVEYRRDRSSDRYYNSCSTQRTYCRSLSVTTCGHTCTPTIRRSMASAVQPQPLSSRRQYLHVSTTWLRGCSRTGSMQLNTAKTEVIWCASDRRQHQLPQVDL